MILSLVYNYFSQNLSAYIFAHSQHYCNVISHHHPKQRRQVLWDPTLDRPTLLFKAILTTVLENDEFTLVWRNSFETIQNTAPSRLRYTSRCLCRLLLFYTHIIRTRGLRFSSVVSPKINGKYSTFSLGFIFTLYSCKSYQNWSWPDPSPTKLTLNKTSALGSYKYATKIQNLSATLLK